MGVKGVLAVFSDIKKIQLFNQTCYEMWTWHSNLSSTQSFSSVLSSIVDNDQQQKAAKREAQIRQQVEQRTATHGRSALLRWCFVTAFLFNFLSALVQLAREL